MDNFFDDLSEDLPASVFVHFLRDNKLPPHFVKSIFKKYIDNCFDFDIL